MKMTPAILVLGSLLVFWSSTYIGIVLPAMTLNDHQSPQWREPTADEEAGHRLYVNNGCSYCHSLYIRTVDWDGDRVAEGGDYYAQAPAILGTERTGPDLSQEGGLHPDDWQIAHFVNPRYTRPLSLMPSWEFLGQRDIELLTKYMQSLGGKNGDERMTEQNKWRKPAQAAYAAGPAANIKWLHDQVPAPWRPMPNPYPATPSAISRGKATYQQFCINCHGPVGDGNGKARPYLDPPPLNFTTLRGHLYEGKYIGGIFYYQIMNGITGTAMPLFKRELESEKIWDVSNYIAVEFLGYTDATMEPRGIPAGYETPWTNPYQPPATQAASHPAK